MPIYAYRCEGCGFQKDALQKLSDPPLVDCPQCGQPKMVKQVTAAGFALKGTGWYVTDFRDTGKKTTNPSESKPSAAAESATAGASPAAAATPATPATSAPQGPAASGASAPAATSASVPSSSA